MLTITSDRTKGSTERSDAENDREQLRKEAETLVQATEEARRPGGICLCKQKRACNKTRPHKATLTQKCQSPALQTRHPKNKPLQTSSFRSGTNPARTLPDGCTDGFSRRANCLILAHPRLRPLSLSTQQPRAVCWTASITRGPPWRTKRSSIATRALLRIPGRKHLNEGGRRQTRPGSPLFPVGQSARRRWIWGKKSTCIKSTQAASASSGSIGT